MCLCEHEGKCPTSELHGCRIGADNMRSVGGQRKGERKDDLCTTLCAIHDDHHDDGAPLVTCPDIQKVSRLIGSDPKVHPAKGFRRTLRWLADEWADGRGVS